jgi:hypothetical protein
LEKINEIIFHRHHHHVFIGAGAYVLKLQRDNVILKENAVKLESAISEQKHL